MGFDEAPKVEEPEENSDDGLDMRKPSNPYV